MKLIEPVLRISTEVRVLSGKCYRSIRRELQESQVDIFGQIRFIKGAELADDGKVYYWLSEVKNGAARELTTSDNLTVMAQ